MDDVLTARTRLERTDAAARAFAIGASMEEAMVLGGFPQAAALDRATVRYLGMPAEQYRSLTSHELTRRRGPFTFTLRLPARLCLRTVHGLLDRDVTSAAERARFTADGELVVERGIRGTGPGYDAGTVRIAIGGATARCEVQRLDGRGPSPALREAAHRFAVRVLGYRCELAPLRRAVRSSGETAWFAPVLAARPGLRVPLMATAFEALVWAIVGQQVNLTFASALRAELIRLAQPGGEASADTVLLPHPTPAEVARLDPAELHRRRFSRSKAEWIVSLAEAVSAGTLDLEGLASMRAHEACAALTAYKGIGDWTAQYVMLRGLGFADCVPASDAGLMRQLGHILSLEQRPDAAAVATLLQPLAPARSVACQHVWSWRPQ